MAKKSKIVRIISLIVLQFFLWNNIVFAAEPTGLIRRNNGTLRNVLVHDKLARKKVNHIINDNPASLVQSLGFVQLDLSDKIDADFLVPSIISCLTNNATSATLNISNVKLRAKQLNIKELFTSYTPKTKQGIVNALNDWQKNSSYTPKDSFEIVSLFGLEGVTPQTGIISAPAQKINETENNFAHPKKNTVKIKNTVKLHSGIAGTMTSVSAGFSGENFTGSILHNAPAFAAIIAFMSAATLLALMLIKYVKAKNNSKTILFKTKTATDILKEYPSHIRPENRFGEPGSYINIGRINRAIALSDLHCSFENFQNILDSARINEAMKDKKAHLIITGDIITPASINGKTAGSIKKGHKILLNIIDLIINYPEQVHFLNGNFETIFSLKNIAQYADPQTRKEMEPQEQRLCKYIEKKYGSAGLKIFSDFFLACPMYLKAEIGGKKIIFSHGMEKVDSVYDAINLIYPGRNFQEYADKHPFWNSYSNEIENAEKNIDIFDADFAISGHIHIRNLSESMMHQKNIKLIDYINSKNAATAGPRYLIFNSLGDQPAYLDISDAQESANSVETLRDKNSNTAIKTVATEPALKKNKNTLALVLSCLNKSLPNILKIPIGFFSLLYIIFSSRDLIQKKAPRAPPVVYLTKKGTNHYAVKLHGLKCENYRITLESLNASGKTAYFYQADFKKTSINRATSLETPLENPKSGKMRITVTKLDDNGSPLKVIFKSKPHFIKNAPINQQLKNDLKGIFSNFAGMRQNLLNKKPFYQKTEYPEILWKTSGEGFPAASVYPDLKGVYVPLVEHNNFSDKSKYIPVFGPGSTKQSTPILVKEFFGPVAKNITDIMTEKEEKELIKNITHKKDKLSVNINIPAYHEDEKNIESILTAVKAEVSEIKRIHKNWNVRICVCLNGKEDSRKRMALTIQNIQKKYPKCPLYYINSPLLDKPNALNALLKFSKNYDKNFDSDIFVTQDADIYYEPGTILRAIDSLLDKKKIGIMGVNVKQFSDRTIWEDLTKSVRDKTPSTNPTGALMIMYTKAMPEIPSYAKTDDAYWATFFTDVSPEKSVAKQRARLFVDNEQTIYSGFPRSIKSTIKQQSRFSYGDAQIDALLGADKNNAQKSFRQDFEKFYRLGIKQKDFKYCLGFILWKIITNKISRFFTNFEKSLRTRTGLYKKYYNWNPDKASKSTPQAEKHQTAQKTDLQEKKFAALDKNKRKFFLDFTEDEQIQKARLFAPQKTITAIFVDISSAKHLNNEIEEIKKEIYELDMDSHNNWKNEFVIITTQRSKNAIKKLLEDHGRSKIKLLTISNESVESIVRVLQSYGEKQAASMLGIRFSGIKYAERSLSTNYKKLIAIKKPCAVVGRFYNGTKLPSELFLWHRNGYPASEKVIRPGYSYYDNSIMPFFQSPAGCVNPVITSSSRAFKIIKRMWNKENTLNPYKIDIGDKNLSPIIDEHNIVYTTQRRLPENKTVVIIETHPDDAFFAAYKTMKELLSRGNKVIVIGITNGADIGPQRSALSEKEKIRIEENRRFFSEMSKTYNSNLSYIRADLNFRDGEGAINPLDEKGIPLFHAAVPRIIQNEDVQKLSEILEKETPDIVIMPDARDSHFEHVMTHQLALRAIQKTSDRMQTDITCWLTPFFSNYTIDFCEREAEIIVSLDNSEQNEKNNDFKKYFSSQADEMKPFIIRNKTRHKKVFSGLAKKFDIPVAGTEAFLGYAFHPSLQNKTTKNAPPDETIASKLLREKNIELLEKAGSSTTATVYKARDIRTNKIIKLRFFTPKDTRITDTGFKNGAIVLNKVMKLLEGEVHYGIPAFYYLDKIGNQLFIITEFFEGKTIKQAQVDGTFQKLMEGNKGLENYLNLLIETVQIVRPFHQRGITLGDAVYNANNLLLTNSNHIVCHGDFDNIFKHKNKNKYHAALKNDLNSLAQDFMEILAGYGILYKLDYYNTEKTNTFLDTIFPEQTQFNRQLTQIITKAYKGNYSDSKDLLEALKQLHNEVVNSASDNRDGNLGLQENGLTGLRAGNLEAEKTNRQTTYQPPVMKQNIKVTFFDPAFIEYITASGEKRSSFKGDNDFEEIFTQACLFKHAQFSDKAEKYRPPEAQQIIEKTAQRASQKPENTPHLIIDFTVLRNNPGWVEHLAGLNISFYAQEKTAQEHLKMLGIRKEQIIVNIKQAQKLIDEKTTEEITVIGDIPLMRAKTIEMPAPDQNLIDWAVLRAMLINGTNLKFLPLLPVTETLQSIRMEIWSTV